MTAIPLEDLDITDLIVGDTYRGGSSGSIADEPISKLMGCGNMGGFRIVGGASSGGYKLAVLFSTFRDADWPDQLDEKRGILRYFGDNKEPGRELHDTSPGGNALLRNVFEAIHVDPPRRELVPPFFVFSGTGSGRDVRFHGLAAPGAHGIAESKDLVASWKTRGQSRFQNYLAVFTILNAGRISRDWVRALREGRGDSASAPGVWSKWISTGAYEPLLLEE